ncbi:hypothetical protein FRX31_006318 [Thalictrum thalictroides]|uniref:Uncharacterized protein n=1 Tax=Thalictrum thalictroides TaxID=46969 RepID=A0A7J6X5I3_THATH|nr:hypothetical protein FRX31_006318 [Thalictrum thalictroides]
MEIHVPEVNNDKVGMLSKLKRCRSEWEVKEYVHKIAVPVGVSNLASPRVDGNLGEGLSHVDLPDDTDSDDPVDSEDDKDSDEAKASESAEYIYEWDSDNAEYSVF